VGTNVNYMLIKLINVLEDILSEKDSHISKYGDSLLQTALSSAPNQAYL